MSVKLSQDLRPRRKTSADGSSDEKSSSSHSEVVDGLASIVASEVEDDTKALSPISPMDGGHAQRYSWAPAIDGLSETSGLVAPSSGLVVSPDGKLRRRRRKQKPMPKPWSTSDDSRKSEKLSSKSTQKRTESGGSGAGDAGGIGIIAWLQNWYDYVISALSFDNLKKCTLNIVSFNVVFCPCLFFAILTLPLSMIASRMILGSFTWTLRRNYLLARGMYRVLGLTGLVLPCPIIYVYQSATLISLLVDLILFPYISSIEVKAPVFVTGCPRSGTTYCHQVLTTKSDNADKFVVFRLWEILFPALCVRYLIQPLVLLIDKVLSMFDGYDILEGAYDYRLNGDAHEEAILSLHAMCGDFWVEPSPLGFSWDLQALWLSVDDKKKSPRATDTGDMSPPWSRSRLSDDEDDDVCCRRKEHDIWRVHTRFLKQMLQRQIYFSGKTQVVAKSPSLTWCTAQLVEEFPDCKVVLIARNPNEMLKSNFSLMQKSWSLLYGEQRMEALWSTAVKNLIWRRHEQWRRTLHYLRHAVGDDKARVLVIRYDDLKDNITAVIEKVFEHCELPLDEDVLRWARSEELRQKARKRRHSVKSFSDYKVPVRPVREAFREVTEYFQFPTDWQ